MTLQIWDYISCLGGSLGQFSTKLRLKPATKTTVKCGEVNTQTCETVCHLGAEEPSVCVCVRLRKQKRERDLQNIPAAN